MFHTELSLLTAIAFFSLSVWSSGDALIGGAKRLIGMPETDLSLGLAYRLGKHVSIRPNYTYTDNDSNIVINDYQRHVVSVDIRYER